MKNEYIAKTFFGLEEILANELNALKLDNVKILRRAVSFEGDQEAMYKANMYSRTALKILQTISTFRVINEDNLYASVRRINWSKYLTYSDTLAVEAVVVNSDQFKHTKYVALKTKDAIVDYFRDKFGKRPDVDTVQPTIRVHVHISDQTCSLSLDTSGEPLFKRGYREATQEAPINEVLAAAMVLLSGWDTKSAFIDPMCGSGTIPIEAGLIACNIAPGLLRKDFAFERWYDFDPKLLDKIRDEAADAVVSRPDLTIYASDISIEAVSIAQRNADNAGLSGVIEVTKQSHDMVVPPTEGGVLISNPPYGERLNQDNLAALYQGIGDKLKKDYAGYSAWIISSNFALLKNVGLRPDKKITLYNGSLECKFCKYSVYSGSKKAKYQQD